MFVLDADKFRQARITLSLIFINIICFIIFNLVLPAEYIYLLLQSNKHVIEDQEYWRLFSAMFLHADLMHLASNMLALLIFGTTIETSSEISNAQYFIIYFISGLIGNLFSLMLLPLNSLSLGASGCIFGLVGAAFILLAREDRSLLFLGLFYIAYFMIFSLAPGINLWAHLFGLLGGIGFGFLFTDSKKRKYERY